MPKTPRVRIVSRAPVSGGHSDATKERVHVVVTDEAGEVEQIALLKRTSEAEISALRRASAVPDATAVPRVIAAGADADGSWVMLPFYDGRPAEDETLLPRNVLETLARLHAHYLDRPLPGRLPVVDSGWWRAKCAVSAERLHALGRPATSALAREVTALRDEQRVVEALDTLPRTLLHGDVHRNNVLVDERGRGMLVDWGGALVGAPALDIANLGGPAGDAYRTYVDTWESLTGERLGDAAWRRSRLAATVWANVKYLAFAAKVFGDDTARSMWGAATAALAEW